MWKTRVILDGHGHWQMLRVKPSNKKFSTFSFACNNICEHPLHRPHLTCLTCRGRRVYMKQMKSKIAVTPYMLLIQRDRRFKKIKNQLLKHLLTLAEMLAN